MWFEFFFVVCLGFFAVGGSPRSPPPILVWRRPCSRPRQVLCICAPCFLRWCDVCHVPEARFPTCCYFLPAFTSSDLNVWPSSQMDCLEEAGSGVSVRTCSDLFLDRRFKQKKKGGFAIGVDLLD